MENFRSHCPTNLAVELLGDKWSLLIIRDLMIQDKRHFREMLASDEKISTNILADRLSRLEQNGLISKRQHPNHKQKIIYSLSQMGIDLFPVLLSIAEWSCKYLPVDEESRKQAQSLIRGGNPTKLSMMKELASKHLE